MFDIGWTELLVIGVVALIVIGPKDLPMMFQQLGRFTGKLRRMAREFQGAMEDAAREAGVKEAADDLKKATSAKSLGLDAVKQAADRFEKWDPLKPTAGPARAQPDPDAAPPADAPAPTPSATGTETQALAEKQAARRAILNETGDRLRALKDGETPAEKAPDA